MSAISERLIFEEIEFLGFIGNSHERIEILKEKYLDSKKIEKDGESEISKNTR
jgi:hypothetical protein